MTGIIISNNGEPGAAGLRGGPFSPRPAEPDPDNAGGGMIIAASVSFRINPLWREGFLVLLVP